jgi:hypothetical protein
VGSAMGFGHAQVGQQQCQRFGCHQGAAIRVDSQIPSNDALFRACLCDQALG